MAAATPGMTTANALQREPTAGNGAVTLNGLQTVSRATRRVATSRGRAEQSRFDRRQPVTVRLQPEYEDVLKGIHSGAFSSFARRMAERKSRSTSESCFPTIDGRATRTTRTGSRKSC